MIVVDSSVWIPYLHGFESDEVGRLEAIPDPAQIVVGDLVLMEVLQGARSEATARTIELKLQTFRVAQMSGEAIVIEAARNYRRLRGLGVTIRKTIDVIIATYCIAHGHHLLHRDSDFGHFERHLGLKAY